ncbi:acetylcholinesterase [Dermacentor silvarum]|nr:acetylcholinesterase [Dermacentor silvarum]
MGRWREAGILFSALLIWTAASSDVLVAIRQGQIRGRSGTILGHPINIFLGIPYANPPVGQLRFRKPEPKTPWSGVYDATFRKSSCSQPRLPTKFPIPAHLSEDCLYLNVWTPSTTDAVRRPVFVWMYGGIFILGSSYQDMYNATVLSAVNDLVVVSFDYRSSVFGFLDADNPEGPGNVALWDQRLVLEWVQKNIASFGGDPETVTLSGVSSGSMMAHAHVMSPLSSGLFRRVFLMSGTLMTDTTVDAVPESIFKGNEVARILGCANSFQDLTTHTERVLDCLRKVPTGLLLRATVLTMLPKFIFFIPTFKTEFIPLLPSAASEAGAFAPIDAVVSVTANEGTFPFTYQPDRRLLEPDLRDVSIEYLRSSLKEMLNMWEKDKVVPLGVAYLERAPPDDKLALRETACDFFGKQNSYCPSRLFAEGHSNKGAKVYGQVFAHRSKMATTPEWMGVTHMDDVPYNFGIPFLDVDSYTDEDRNVSLDVMRSLANFARSGTPGLPGFKNWPQFSLEDPSFVWLQPGNYGIVNDFYSTGCELWRKFL